MWKKDSQLQHDVMTYNYVFFYPSITLETVML